MTKYILITGGKGGTGKTTTAINLGIALNFFGKDVTIVDANLTTPNIGIHLGAPVVPIHLNHALQGKNHISEAVYMHNSGTKVIPASISLQDLKNTNPNNLKKTLRGLTGTTDFVILDGAAGLGRETLFAIDAADEILIVTNPEMPAVTDALKTIKLAEEIGKKVIGVIVTRTKDKKDISIRNIEAILEKPVIGVIPEDSAIRDSLIKKDAVIYTAPKSLAAKNYKRLAADLVGIDYDLEPEKKPNLFVRLFKSIGIG